MTVYTLCDKCVVQRIYKLPPELHLTMNSSNVERFFLCRQEGPHSTLPDDEFYDAVETGFDKMERSVPPPSVHTRDQVELPPPHIDNRLTQHTLWNEV